MPDAVRARVEYDAQFFGVRAVIGAAGGLRVWPLETGPSRVFVQPGEQAVVPEGSTEYLRLNEEEARALYEALADYFGGTGHDTRALRRDYDDERKRVDRLTDAVVRIAEVGPRIVVVPDPAMISEAGRG